MFPANEATVQSHRAGWLNRIMGSQQQHLLNPVATHRTFTPLRPNAGMANRVPTPNQQLSSGSRPSTQAGTRSQPAVPVPQQPNSARGAPPRLPSLKGDSTNSGGGDQSQRKAVPPLRGSALDAADDLSGSSKPSPASAKLNPLHHSEADPFLERELAVIDELNVMRRDPRAYAAIAEAELRVLEPFVVPPTDPTAPPMDGLNLEALKALAADEAKRLEEAKARLETLENDEEKVIAQMREQWAVEDAERSKKKGKAPAPKKGKDAGATSVNVQSPEEIEAEREAEIARLREDNERSRVATRAEITALVDSSKRASQGVKVLSMLAAKLRATPSLPLLERSRGLCLAARDLADNERDGSVGVDPTIYTRRFGGGEGPFGQCLALGRLSPREAVLDLLLCLHDPGKRRGRQALLNPLMRCVGCGWRRNVEHEAATAVIVAGNYAEFAAIASRSHLPLQDIRRALPFATKMSTNTSVKLDVPRNSGIEVAEPASHPIKTDGKRVRAVIRCPPETIICAAVVAAGEQEPAQPSFVANTTFVQRTQDGSGVEVHAAIPGDGTYHVVLYGQVPPPTDGIGFAGTQTRMFGSSMGFGSMTPRGLGQFGSSVTASGPEEAETAANAFRRLGAIIVHADDTDPMVPPPVFPVPTTDFHERRCRVESPLSGVLRPDAAYTFRLVVPLTAYKAAEFSRIETSLQAAQRKVDGSTSRTEKLEAEVQAATEAIAAAEQEAATVVPAAQQEAQALQRDMAKKKGKELDKAKAALAEAEERLKAAEGAVAAAHAAKATAEERLSMHRRAARQASAMRLRYLADHEQLVALTDRSKPLDVEIAVDDRRAKMPPLGDDGVAYEVTVRTPKHGQITLFIANVAVLEYSVSREALEWPDSVFE